jgi:hypothetical protein
MVSAHAFAHEQSSSEVRPLASEVSTTLSINAAAAFEIFTDAAELPRWLPIIQSARVLAHQADGRAAKVAFVRRLERGSFGYTLEYTYNVPELTVMWQTAASSNVVLGGEARFVPLSTRACLMHYRLLLDLPIIDELTHGELDTHPASVVVAEFREHLRRLC